MPAAQVHGGAAVCKHQGGGITPFSGHKGYVLPKNATAKVKRITQLSALKSERGSDGPEREENSLLEMPKLTNPEMPSLGSMSMNCPAYTPTLGTCVPCDKYM